MDEGANDLFIDLTDDSREDGVRSVSVFGKEGLRRLEVSRRADGDSLVEIVDPDGPAASVVVSRIALGKLVQALLATDFIPERPHD